MRFSLLSLLPTTALFTLGCGALGLHGDPVEINGIEIYADYWNKAIDQLEPRAKFDAHCPAEQLSYTLLRKVAREAVEVGVTGCGVELVYVRDSYRNRVGNTWVLNSHRDLSPSPTAAQKDELEL